ncbi:MAG: malto-oligosyltrehalose synthase [Pseudolabrys sp.]|nr:malto-oligosyltrehalose synthase [Pseudolabrys sp.]
MPPTVPLATYRVQLTRDFGFDQLADIVPYLGELGITHLYASPFLKARPGSTHGYDIVDHDRLNPELGGEQGFARLAATLNAHDMGLILDFVPNHMGVGHADNAWWLDVLEWGPMSPHAAAFDIDWLGLPYRRHPGVLIPILGRPYGEALRAGEIALRYDAPSGSFSIWYFQHQLPVNPRRYAEVLRTCVATAGAATTMAGRALIALADDYRDPRAPSYREAPDLKRRLAAIDGAEDIITRGLAAYRCENESGMTALHRLLERQYYRVAYWRVAFSNINYRRFFDINDLAGLRIENAGTFRAVHTLVARLIESGQLQGLRLDHIDGLRDPAQYIRRLQRLVARHRPGSRKGRFYLVVEKILAEGETTPAWPGVAGTTGYEWLNLISRVLVAGAGLVRLDLTWRNFTGEQASFRTILEQAKQHVIETMLASEFTVLVRSLARIAAGHPATRDFTSDRLRLALQLYVLEFPVYRTYVTAAGASPVDRTIIDRATTRARARWQGPDAEIFDFLRNAATIDLAKNPGFSAPRVRDFALRLQQFTGPLMAKAMEDTAFYRHHRLLALNEVGGHPELGAVTLGEFHALQRRRMNETPHGLTATATHDTKRGEDARMRILALSELADEWDQSVRSWRDMNRPLVGCAAGRRVPSCAHEYLVYQTLIGAWPGVIDRGFVERMKTYAVKAARESKQETSWTNVNETYEAALSRFVEALLDPALSAAFISSFASFAARTSLIGFLNTLSQLALKTLLPGVPDFYQGTELLDLSLVDPDNRRPVDFALRMKEAAHSPDRTKLIASCCDGRIKFALMRELLDLRRRFPDLFQQGTYEPIQVTGAHAEHVIAFAREWKNRRLIVAIGRHFGPLTQSGRRWPARWEAWLALPPGRYECLIGHRGPMNDTGVDALFRERPVSVMFMRAA